MTDFALSWRANKPRKATISTDIFMDKSFLEKLPKGWNYSKVRAYLIRVKKNPQNYTKKQIEYAFKLAKYLAHFYSTHRWIITSQEKDGLLSYDRFTTMHNLGLNLMFVKVKDDSK